MIIKDAGCFTKTFRESTLAYYSLVGGLLFLSLLSLGLAYGIYRASRLCAITTTVLFLTGMMRGHFSKAETAYWWPLMLTFGSLYLLGVIGCFAWHARGRDSAYTLERSLPTAQRKD